MYNILSSKKLEEKILMIYDIICKIPDYDLMYILPIEIDNDVISYNFSDYAIPYQKNNNKNNNIWIQRYLKMSLDKLHEKGIFCYIGIADLFIHRETGLPLICLGPKNCIIGSREQIIEVFSKPIAERAIPFDLFYLHYIVSKKQTNLEDPSHIFNQYKSIFSHWKPIENTIASHTLNDYMKNKEQWYKWDYILANNIIKNDIDIATI